MTINNTRIKADFSFFAVVAFLLLLDKSGTAALSLSACVLHELGHIAASVLCKAPPEAITFYGGGILLSQGDKSVSRKCRLIILSAGCIANFICFAVGYFNPWGIIQLRIFGAVNLLVGLFNLLPVGYFDGAAMLKIALQSLLPYNAADFVERILGIIFCTAAFVAVAVYCILSAGKVSLSLGITVLYLLAAQLSAGR